MLVLRPGFEPGSATREAAILNRTILPEPLNWSTSHFILRYIATSFLLSIVPAVLFSFFNKLRCDYARIDGLSDVDACLKIYKRLLLLVSDKLPTPEFQKRIELYQTTKTVNSTKYGKISIEETKDVILRFPKDQRLSSIIESFNPLVSWVYVKVLGDLSFDNAAAVLETLRHVLRLNRERAIQLRIYPTLFERLAAKIPQEEIDQLYHEYLEEVIEQKSGELQHVRSRLLDAELSAIGRLRQWLGTTFVTLFR